MRTPERQRLCIAIGVATATCFVTWLVFSRIAVDCADDSVGQIAQAANAMRYRTLQSRLAGSFDYRPLRSNVRGPANENGDSDARLEIMAVSARLAATGESIRDLHDLGVSYLLLGQTDKAIAVLEKAVQRDTRKSDVPVAIRSSHNTSLLNDLAAAYVERASRTQSASDRVTSLGAAQRAWELAKTPETTWNRALALELIYFREAIRDAWAEYLRLDGGSAWSVEAHAHLALVQQPTLMESWTAVESRFDLIATGPNREELRTIVARFPQQVRMRAEDVLLPRWSKGCSEGTLRGLRAIGETLAEQNGEHVVIAIVNAMERATPDKQHRLIKAYEQYTYAKRLYETNQAGASIEGLQRASHMFTADDAPVMASLADVSAAGAMFMTEQYARSFLLATGALTRLDDDHDRYPSLVARLEWMRGLCHLALGRPHESLQSYDHALAAAERAGERDYVAALQNLRGEAREAIGDTDGGLESRLAAVRTKSAVGGRSKSEQILAGVTRALFVQGHLDLALQFIEITSAHPQFGDRADFASEVLLLRGVILQKLGREADARGALDSARRYALKSGDEQVSAAMLADVDAALALNASSGEPSHQRLTRLTTALAHARRTGNRYHQSGFLLQRARALREVGDVAAAEADLRAGLDEVNLQRRTIPGREARAMYFASARELVTDLIDLLLDGSKVEEAFNVAEGARAHGLLDPSDRHGAHDVLTHEQIAASLHANETLVSNVALPDRLVTWVVSRAGMRVAENAISRDALEQLLVRHNGDERQADIAVYDAVIAKADAEPLSRCVFIPDPALPPVMLAVLKDPRGSYLIEKYPIIYEPSATEYVRSLHADARLRRVAPPRVYAAAASFFDSALFSDLLPLRAAESEVERIASVHAGATTALAREVTVERFLAGAAEAEIVHFAGHATGGGVSAGAALVMAPDIKRGDAGLLYARMLAERTFPRTRLVVLAACGVTARADVDARAIGSVAYAFLAAGVPAVVTTVRPVDDRIAAAFTPHLHAALLEKGDAAAALQATQVSFIRSSDPSARDPRNWAAFQLFGNYNN